MINFWVMTDFHFGHKAMIELCGRPINFEDRILKGLKIIKDEDILIFLGDICIGKDEY